MAEAVLKITENKNGSVMVLELAGEIDAHTAPILKESAEKKISEGNVKLVFNFANCTYISSAGIGVLNAILNSVKAKGGIIAVSEANKTITDTFKVMYFTKKVQLYIETAAAVKDLQ
ncbi:MAG TPA: STAS domain-containing protein [Spirochaetota bacterium]|nr:STAS domain-containing protein [Spirochaetota bacterium]HOR44239.1 STAS domain-containing protein [Spirochaetota bacterium]HOU84671.1 STAS domain-containing protein [Spirochaetota bacterium]HPK55649.1 STAS domain-containing protein [Spirochaetota bacterium]HQE57743.1 STAS domain-containing protein [Spirochaetota bacterium]